MHLSWLILLFFLVQSIEGALYNCDPTSSCGCSSVSSTSVMSRIIGGEPAKNLTWGWMLSFQYHEEHICGASLLTDEYAITAAHCLSNSLDSSFYSVVAGTNYLHDKASKIAQRSDVKEIHIHPQYNSKTYAYDIAILRLSRLSVNAKSKLKYICLPREGQDPFQVDTDLIIIGWGTINSLNDVTSQSLQQVMVKAIASTSKECKRVQETDPKVHFCAGLPEGGRDSCQGDSGGPVMAFVDNRWVLAGITSAGIGCALPGFAGLYTRVSSFIPYIESIVDISQLTNSNTSSILKSLTENHATSLWKSMFLWLCPLLFVLVIG